MGRAAPVSLKRPVGENFKVGKSLANDFLAEYSVSPSRKTPIIIGEKNGGDDETRTRDLCRDSAPSFGNCLKLRGTDGYQNRALEPQVTFIGP